MKIIVTGRPDLKALSAIHTASFYKGWSAAYFAESMRVEGTLALISRDKMGFALLRVPGEEARLLSLAVRPAARGTGLGSALLAAALKEARLREAKAVFLKVNERNAAGVSFYRKRGFFLISRENEVYSNPDGIKSAALEMRYLIE